MLSFFRSPPESTRESLLGALPVRNELVREEDGGRCLRLVAPLHAGRMQKIFAGSAGKGRREKTFELDELGAWVWGQCDGKRSVEALITAFAKNFRVNLREAEVAVLAFLKTLTQRNLIAHVAPRSSGAASGHRSKKQRRRR